MNSHFLLKACESCFFEKPRITCVFDRTNTNHRFSKEYRPSRTTQCKPRRGGRVIASRGWSAAEPTAGVVFWSAIESWATHRSAQRQPASPDRRAPAVRAQLNPQCFEILAVARAHDALAGVRLEACAVHFALNKVAGCVEEIAASIVQRH